MTYIFYYMIKPKIVKLCQQIAAKKLFVDTVMITCLTAFGKSIGFLVPFFIAAWFGVSNETDVFFFVYGLVLFLIGVFAGAIENVLVPYISELISGDKKQLELFIGTIFTFCIIGLSVITVIFVFIAMPVFRLVTNFSSTQLNLLSILLLEIAPLFVLLTLTSVLTGVLNAYKIFWLPAISPAFRALITLGVIFLLKSKLGIHALTIGYILGELVRLMALVLFIFFKKIFFLKLRFDFDGKVQNFLRTVFYQSVAMIMVGFNPIIDRAMASWLGKGSVTIFEYADRLYAIPLAFLSSGFFVATLTHWSSDYHAFKDIVKLKVSMYKAMKTIFLIAVFITIALTCFSEFIVSCVYGHGKIPKSELQSIQNVWVLYLVGLTPQMLGQICAIGHLIMKRTRLLMSVAFGSSALNIALNFILMNAIGLAGISLATSIVQIFSFTIFLILLNKALNGGVMYEL